MWRICVYRRQDAVSLTCEKTFIVLARTRATVLQRHSVKRLMENLWWLSEKVSSEMIGNGEKGGKEKMRNSDMDDHYIRRRKHESSERAVRPLPLSESPYCANSIDIWVPRGQLSDIYSASQPAFWYVRSVPASSAEIEKTKIDGKMY